MHLSFSRATLLFSSLSLVFAATGCGKDDCEKLYDQMAKCDPDEAKEMSKSDFVTMCKAAKSTAQGKEMMASEMACVGKSCAEAETCKTAQRGKKRAQEVTKAVAAGDYGDAFSNCSISADY